MVSLNVAATWTRMLSVTAGACASAGAPGPGTRVRGKPALEWIAGPWLGLIDFDGLERAEREALHAWLFGQAEPLLLVRNLLMAKPLGEEIWTQTKGEIDAFVHCVGTAASSRGVASVLKRHRAGIRIVAVEPAESSVLLGGRSMSPRSAPPARPGILPPTTSASPRRGQPGTWP